ncbi:MAG: hypothetical protein QW699_02065 [Metallosphaera sp.]
MVKCPYCDYEGEFKTLKTWRFSFWNVTLHQCPKCSGKFRYQIDPTGKYKNFTMKIIKQGRRSKE